VIEAHRDYIIEELVGDFIASLPAEEVYPRVIQFS